MSCCFYFAACHVKFSRSRFLSFSVYYVNVKWLIIQLCCRFFSYQLNKLTSVYIRGLNQAPIRTKPSEPEPRKLRTVRASCSTKFSFYAVKYTFLISGDFGTFVFFGPWNLHIWSRPDFIGIRSNFSHFSRARTKLEHGSPHSVGFWT